jgi:hypothetical protein
LRFVRSKDEEPTDDVDATAHASVVKEVTPSLMDTLKTAVSEADEDDAERAKAEANSSYSPSSTRTRASC